MKLVDQIQQVSGIKISDYSKIYYPTIEAIEKIADDYAIGFAQWLLQNKDELKKTLISNEDLIKQFKKEKGL